MPPLALCALALAATEPLTIVERDGGWAVTAPAYRAVVGADGQLTSLAVDGIEFLRSAASFPRGIYLYQGQIRPFTTVTRPEPTVILAESELATVRYACAADSLTVILTNRTAQLIQWVGVLAAGLAAVADETGRFRKPAIEGAGPRVAFHRDGAVLTLDAAARWWGPWSEQGNQVWEFRVAGGQTGTVVLRPGRATAEEARRAAETAAMVVEPPRDPEGPMWDLKRFEQAPRTWPAEGFEQAGLRAIYYEGPVYDGRPTRIFAWLGLPQLPPGERAPGMVLVHGGGGTAFPEWVKLWVDRGYAALSLDTCGCTSGGAHGQRPRHEWGGPPGWGGWAQLDWPREDQWTFQAVAAVLLGHSLLRSLPAVDPERIGLTGISWGGYLTSIVAGVDPRFKFAAPVYGCGWYEETGFNGALQALTPERRERWRKWWDPKHYLPHARMPLLWVSGTNDFAYWLPALQQSYRATAGPRTLAVRLRMPHGQEQGAAPREIHAFAEHLLNTGPGLATFTGVKREGRAVSATFTPATPLKSAELLFTKDTGKWPDRQWEAIPATLAEGQVTATLPEGVTCWFLNLIDEVGLVVSCEHEEIDP